MRSKRQATIENLRTAIESLPRATKVAMLHGIASNEIIVGAYTDGHGICPMLAAHRAGGRTNLISFAKAWDRFALSGVRVSKPRPATARELLVLRSHLEASLLEEDTPAADLACAIQEHRQLMDRRELIKHRERLDRRELIKQRERLHRRAKTESRPGPDRAGSSRQVRPGDPDRRDELRAQPGWRWMRLVRRYDEYRWALEQVQAQQEAPARPSADSEQQDVTQAPALS